MELDIINLFGFTPKDGIRANMSKWGKNFVQDHPSCILGTLEQGLANGFEL
jgi:hypothetical protein